MISVIVKSSMMIDICSCCNGCSSTRQLSTYPRYSFPKKLLVAIALVVIIVMFVTPTEARTLQRRQRHKPATNMALTKESPRTNTRPFSEHSRRLPTKDIKRPKNTRAAQLYKRETKKIFRKLKNTRSFFKFQKEEEMKEYRETAPSWLPTVNFVDVHFHDYNLKKHGNVKLETKFKYIMPKLYKSLVEYQELFKVFDKMELKFPDIPIKPYKSKRQQFLKNTLDALDSTIQEVNDSMTAVGLIERPNRLKDFSMFDTKVSMTQCLRLDYLAFRGYGNLLNNWVSELRCLKKNKRPAIQKQCEQWEMKLIEKRDGRKNPTQPNKNKRSARVFLDDSMSLAGALFIT